MTFIARTYQISSSDLRLADLYPTKHAVGTNALQFEDVAFIHQVSKDNPYHLFKVVGTYISEYGKPFRITFKILDDIVFDSREDKGGVL